MKDAKKIILKSKTIIKIPPTWINRYFDGKIVKKSDIISMYSEKERLKHEREAKKAEEDRKLKSMSIQEIIDSPKKEENFFIDEEVDYNEAIKDAEEDEKRMNDDMKELAIEYFKKKHPNKSIDINDIKIDPIELKVVSTKPSGLVKITNKTGILLNIIF